MRTEEIRKMTELEAVLFALGGLQELAELAEICDLDPRDCENLLQELELKYQADETSAIVLRRVESRYGLTCKASCREILEQVFQPQRRAALSPAAYETLAVIAYNRQATRAQVEAVRGVNSDAMISRLQDRGLIEQCGQLDAPGRPALFSVTDRFMLECGLKDLDELPPLALLQYESLQSLEED